MRKGNKWKATALLLTAALILPAASPVSAGAKKKPALNRKKVTLTVGKSCILKVKGTKKKVRWSTSKKKVAVVSKKGKVTAKKQGTAKITAKIKGMKQALVCKVTVKKKNGEQVSENGPGTDIPRGPVNDMPSRAPVATPAGNGNQTAEPVRTPDGTATMAPGQSAEPSQAPVNSELPVQTNDPGSDMTAKPTETPAPVPTVEADPVPDEFFQILQPEYETGTPECPELSADSGVYGNAFMLGMKSQPGTKIYYTTDGSIPTAENGTLYTDPFVVMDRNGMPNVLTAAANIKKMYISGSGYDYVPKADEVAKCTVIRAAAVSPDQEVSDVVTRSFFIGNDVKKKYAGATVASLVIDPNDLLNAETGIHVLGNKYDEWSKTPEAAKIIRAGQYWDYEGNYTQSGRDWERVAFMDYLDADSETLEFSIPVGIRVRGGASRMYGQKGFNVYLREEYGQKNLKYPLIPGDLDTEGKQIKKYKSFMLRNGGNDTEYSKIRDVFNQSMVGDRNYSVQAARPCVLFINGEYWGLYNLTEKYSDNSIENKYGVDKDNVIIFKEDEMDEGQDGDEVLYQELWSYAEKDFTDDAVYEAFCGIMDIDSFADYYATEIYIANEDWNPEKNYMLWRARTPDEANPYADGKWRYMLYDTEYSMGLYGGGWGNDPVKTDSFTAAVGQDALFAAVIKNKAFQQKFLAVIKEIGSGNFAPDACEKKLEEYKNTYKPLMQDYYTRFFGKDTWNRNKFDETVQSVTNFVKNRYQYIISYVERGMK